MSNFSEIILLNIVFDKWKQIVCPERSWFEWIYSLPSPIVCTDVSGHWFHIIKAGQSLIDYHGLQIRDPPAEGMFVFGLYLWGCAWEKTTGDLQDSAPKQACTTLPVVHLTCWPAADKPMLQVGTLTMFMTPSKSF